MVWSPRPFAPTVKDVRTLRQALDEGLDAPAWATAVRCVAAELDRVHAGGAVHGDIAAETVLLPSAGPAGLARPRPCRSSGADDDTLVALGPDRLAAVAPEVLQSRSPVSPPVGRRARSPWSTRSATHTPRSQVADGDSSRPAASCRSVGDAVLPAGTTFGGLRIEHVVGRGATAVVYAARHAAGGRVAVKILRGGMRDDPDARARLLHEARLQTSLTHPGVLPVRETGLGPHGPYLVTALVDGVTLRQLARARALGVRRALALLEQVAGALDAVHAAGVLHRDVKPSNVLVDGDDRAYLADFGVAQHVDDPHVAGRLTGTVAYLAPELALGGPSTEASDRYAFAAVAFESLCGEVPFPRQEAAAVLFAHVDDPPPLLRDRAPGLPAGFDAILQAGLAKDPAARPVSAAALVAALRDALPEADHEPAVRPCRARRLAARLHG